MSLSIQQQASDQGAEDSLRDRGSKHTFHTFSYRYSCRDQLGTNKLGNHPDEARPGQGDLLLISLAHTLQSTIISSLRSEAHSRR